MEVFQKFHKYNVNNNYKYFFFFAYSCSTRCRTNQISKVKNIRVLLEIRSRKVLREKLMRALNQSPGIEKESKRKKKEKGRREKVTNPCMCPYFRHFLELSKKLDILICICVELFFSSTFTNIISSNLQQPGKQVWLILFSTDKEIE